MYDTKESWDFLKIKYLDGEGWDWLDRYVVEINRVDGYKSGIVSLVYDASVKYKLRVDYEDPSKILFDDGYKCVTFLPDQGNWCVNAIYNQDDKIVEWYFDILKRKGIDPSNRYFYYDLYLDVVVDPDYHARIIDGHELQDALDAGIITLDDFHMAYEVSKEIVNQVVKDQWFMKDFLSGFLPN